MSEIIRLEYFQRKWNRDSYHSYRQIKYRVFVEEQAWFTLRDESGGRIAREDPFDDRGRFWLARTEAGAPVGVVRGIPLREGFPHEHLLEHHFCHQAVGRMFPDLCTLNALAVLPSHRRRTYRVADHEWEGTVAGLLMLTVMHSMVQEGLQGAIATAGGLASARLCSRLGFLAIDAPTRTPLHPEITMTNVGIVFGSHAHMRARMGCRMEPYRAAATLTHNATKLLRYFEHRQGEVLGSNTLGDVLDSVQ